MPETDGQGAGTGDERSAAASLAAGPAAHREDQGAAPNLLLQALMENQVPQPRAMGVVRRFAHYKADDFDQLDKIMADFGIIPQARACVVASWKEDLASVVGEPAATFDHDDDDPDTPIIDELVNVGDRLGGVAGRIVKAAAKGVRVEARAMKRDGKTVAKLVLDELGNIVEAI